MEDRLERRKRHKDADRARSKKMRLGVEGSSPSSEQEITIHADYEEEDIEFGITSPSREMSKGYLSPESMDSESFPIAKPGGEPSRRRKERRYRGAGEEEEEGARVSKIKHRHHGGGGRDREKQSRSPLPKDHHLHGEKLKKSSSGRTSPYFLEERHKQERGDLHPSKHPREDPHDGRGRWEGYEGQRSSYREPREVRRVESREVRMSSSRDGGRRGREVAMRDERRSSLKRSRSPRKPERREHGISHEKELPEHQRKFAQKTGIHRERDGERSRREKHHRHRRDKNEDEPPRKRPASVVVSEIHPRGGNTDNEEEQEEEDSDESESHESHNKEEKIEDLIKDLEGSNSSGDSSMEAEGDGATVEVEQVSNEGGKSDSEGEVHSPISAPVDPSSHPHVMRSKFDSDDDDDEEEDDDIKSGDGGEGGNQQSLGGPRRGYSGYQEALSADEHSGNSDHEDLQEESAEKSGEELPADLSRELDEEEERSPTPELPCYLPALMGCRSVDNYEKLNRIEEGAYGVVFRARDIRTGEVVALKKLKMEKEKEGFPITSLREINMLLKAKHPNIVHVREIVTGSNMDKIFIVMDYVEHDLKALMETMRQPFLPGEVKTLVLQLLRAVHHLHDNWILHRDLKASNLLLSHKGILKVGDFGLAREYGSPLKKYTPVVVTLWYRAPELLLGAKEYSTAVDMWSVGCIFAEFILQKPLFQGKSEIDQLNLIFKELGNPNEQIWPGYTELPIAKKVTFARQPYNHLRKKFPYLTSKGFDLLNRLLTYDPKKRITAKDALDHPYFKEPPMPVPPSMFPTWPAKSEMDPKKKRAKSPTPPEGGAFQLQAGEEGAGPGFSLKF